MKEKYNLRQDFEIGKTSWLGVGGKADFLFRPTSPENLQEFLTENRQFALTILGNISNIIIRDAGIEGVVIRLGGNFGKILSVSETEIEVGAGMLDKNFALEMAEIELSGFEFLSTIPGNLGGGLKMNCGCFGGELSDIFVSAKGFDFKGNPLFFQKKDINFSYRESGISDDIIITSMVLKGVKSSKPKILQKMEENQQKRNESQPTGGKTCGSTFKNPHSAKAWELLQKSGASAMKVGGAFFSSKHSNFLMNDGTATAKDLETLGEMAKKIVFEKFGIKLEWEIKFIGK